MPERRSAIITRRHLRAMRGRWQRDLERLEAAFPGIDFAIEQGSEAETIRNLATAIAYIDGIITNPAPLTRRMGGSDAG